jgi:hypothetical protein
MAAKYNGRALSKHLNLVGLELHSADAEGNPITNEEALARLLWNMALGYEEMTRNEEGTMTRVVHKPVAWAIQYIYDRKEGRAAPTVLEDEGRMKAAEKVRDLAKARLNGLAVSAAGPVSTPAEKKGPPKFKPKKKET